MAHGYLTHFGKGVINGYGAGIETHGVNPRAIKVMAEDGVDISKHTSNNIDEYLDINFEHIITVCDHAKETCPVFPKSGNVVHHSFSDPYGATGTEEEILDQFRKVRDEIKAFIKAFLADKV